MNNDKIKPIYTSIGIECNETDIMASIASNKTTANSKCNNDAVMKTHQFSKSTIPHRYHANKLSVALKQFNIFSSKKQQIALSKPKLIANVSSKYHRNNLMLSNTKLLIDDLVKEKLMRISGYDLYEKTKKKIKQRESVECSNNCLIDKSIKQYYTTLTSIAPIQSSMSIMRVMNSNENKSALDNLRSIGMNRKTKMTIDCLRERILRK